MKNKMENFFTEISKLNLIPVLKVIEKNKYGRKYRIIDFEMVFQGVKTYAAIIPSEELVVAPVIVGNETSFIPTAHLPAEELQLYINKFGG